MKRKDNQTHQLIHWYEKLTYNQLFQLFCVIGAILQIVYVFQQYLKFDFNTRALIYVPDKSKLPDLIFCFDMIYMINYTKLINLYPGLIESTVNTNEAIEKFKKQNTFNGYLNNLTIKQTWDLMLSPQTAIQSAIVWSAESEDKTIPIECPSRPIFYRHAYCFIFMCSFHKPAIAWSRSLYRGSQTTPFFEVAFHQSFMESIRYYYFAMVEPLTIPLGTSIKWESQETLNITTSYRYFFYWLQVNYLPKPYPTDCRNYTKLGFRSRDDMLNKCETQAAIKRTGAPLIWSMIDYPYDTPFGEEISDKRKDDPEYRRNVSEIIEKCVDLARQPDCVSNSYYATIRNPLPILGNLSALSIDHTKDPIYIINYEPAMSILDAIIMIGSILGTWLGFSIASHLPRVTQLFSSTIDCYIHSGSRRKFGSSNQPPPLQSNLKHSRLRGYSQLTHYQNFTKFPYYHRYRSPIFKSRPISDFQFPFYLFYELPKSQTQNIPNTMLVELRNLQDTLSN